VDKNLVEASGFHQGVNITIESDYYCRSFLSRLLEILDFVRAVDPGLQVATFPD
jgi:hypothetical protein